ncbi:MAG: PD40 domain-containing protein, partial [Deltaproteobacteria bacterium]|nr:PD40 domain-containing protein [Deltaproteobacteria bacterium]
MTQHLALLFVFLGASPPGGPDPSKEPAARIAALPPGGCAGAPEDLVPGRNPRFLPDGRRLVFEVGRPGAADLHVLDLGTRAVTPLVVGPGDDCDADPAPDGSQVVFASSRGGSYDLWVVPVEGGAPRRLTDHPGDERRPRWSPVAYRLLGVHPEGCGGPYTSLLDEYGKILYERREGKQTDTLWVSANGLHAGPLARGCAAPSWLPFGRGVLLACGGRVAVLETARVAGVEGAIQASGWSQESWQRDGFPRDEIELDGLDDAALEDFLRQFPSIRRLYTVYEGSRELSGPRDLLERPASSPNGLLVVAESARGGVRARVAAEGAEWGPLGLPEDARGAAWSPDGTRVAFHRAAPGGDRLLVAPTGCPLQRVLNLHQEPLLTRGGVSSRLDRHGWVARPGDHKEF